MKTKLLNKIICSLTGHRLVVTKEITNHIKEYKCTCCETEFTNNYQGVKSKLTPELKDINVTLKHFYQKRQHHRPVV